MNSITISGRILDINKIPKGIQYILKTRENFYIGVVDRTKGAKQMIDLLGKEVIVTGKLIKPQTNSKLFVIQLFYMEVLEEYWRSN